jgi:L-lactate utilization protein LutC
MQSSRDRILARLKEVHAIPSAVPTVSGNIDEAIKKKMETIAPANQTEMWKIFQREFELVSGEYFEALDVQQLAERFSQVIEESNTNTIGTPGDPVSIKISEMLLAKQPQLKIINASDLKERKNVIAGIPVTVATASHCIADTGTLAICYDQVKSSLPFFLADIVLVAISAKNLFANQFDFFKNGPQGNLTNMVCITGPSRTADIEKVLILGAHGPKRVVVGVIRDFIL